MKANFLGLPSCRSLANGRADRESKAMMNALMVIYSGCFSMPIKFAMGWLNRMMSAVIKVVLVINVVVMVW